MQLNLIHNWLNPCVGPNIDQHGHCAVADSDIFNESKIHHALKLRPHLVHGSVKNDGWFSWDEFWEHPMHKIEVNILQLKLGQAASDGSLNIVLFSLI